ncbi:SgcJ/EcaC family oxidoreductase [Archangium sp.]|uniref:SgcJ/EcaC family oxidoreductase n=1 Tax=Archangium sp. TaxID=1872627 RepID=UPI00389A6431
MNPFLRIVAATALALSFCVAPPARAEGARGQSKEEAVLRQLVAEQAEAWNRHDAAAWSKDFAPDADFINIVGSVFRGRAEIEQRHAFVFARVFKESHTQVTVSQVRFLEPGVAVVDMEHVVTGYTGLPPGVQPTEPGVLRTRMRFVMKRTGGRWWIVAGQNTDVKPAPAPPAQQGPGPAAQQP